MPRQDKDLWALSAQKPKAVKTAVFPISGHEVRP